MGRHCVFTCTSIWSSWRNTPQSAPDGDAINRLRTIFAKTCEDFPEAQLIEMHGETIMSTLLVGISAQAAVSNLVNSLKGAFQPFAAQGAP